MIYIFQGIRSGTLPTPLIVGLGEACKVALEEMQVPFLSFFLFLVNLKNIYIFSVYVLKFYYYNIYKLIKFFFDITI
jgi:hypothetical protein